MAKANIRLNLKNVDHRDDPRCHGALDNLPILDVLRPEFRQGGLSTLNMITIPKDPAVPGVRGICSLPSPGDDLTVDSMLKQDVCAIAALGKNYATMIPTFAHEVFHWLGLNHVPFRSFVPGGKDNLMVAGTNVISIHTLSEEQRRVARQWGHIRQNGQKNGFGITHDVADPPPTDVGGTYAPGSGPMPDPEAGNGSPGEGNNELGTGGPPAKATCGDAGNGGRPPDGSYLGYGNAAGFAGNTLGDGGLPGDAPPAAAPGDEQQDVSRQGGQYRRFK
ncbi:hypothetical protein PLIIFM63780_000444 [Purpureocillium lilacinum]|nr:hypothetical protein PLIIFM63780_000444 [Purpureocillium lilacinum]